MNEASLGDPDPDSPGFLLFVLLSQLQNAAPEYLWVVALLFLISSFYFSLVEGALLAFSPTKLLERFGPGHDTELERYSAHRDGMVVSAIMIDVSSNIGFVACMTTWLQIEKGFSGFFGLFVAIFSSLLILIPVGEVFPRSWGYKNSTAILRRTLALQERLSMLLAPIVNSINTFNHFLLRGLGRPEADDATLLVDALQSIVDKGEQQGLLQEEDREMIESVIDFRDIDVREIMTPRTEMICIAAGASLEEAIDLIMREQHSRVPVFEGTRDKIVGVLYAKDLFPFWNDAKGKTVQEVMRPPLFVPETKLARELFREMRSHKTQVAIILDEYGGTDGMVTIEDILEEIVGDIADEYDEPEEDHSLNRIDEFTAEVDGQYPLDEFAEEMAVTMPENDHYETIGGFLFSEMGRVPAEGEEYRFNNVSFRILDATERKINKIHVTVAPNGSEIGSNGKS